MQGRSVLDVLSCPAGGWRSRQFLVARGCRAVPACSPVPATAWHSATATTAATNRFSREICGQGSKEGSAARLGFSLLRVEFNVGRLCIPYYWLGSLSLETWTAPGAGRSGSTVRPGTGFLGPHRVYSTTTDQLATSTLSILSENCWGLLPCNAYSNVHNGFLFNCGLLAIVWGCLSALITVWLHPNPATSSINSYNNFYTNCPP